MSTVDMFKKEAEAAGLIEPQHPCLRFGWESTTAAAARVRYLEALGRLAVEQGAHSEVRRAIKAEMVAARKLEDGLQATVAAHALTALPNSAGAAQADAGPPKVVRFRLTNTIHLSAPAPATSLPAPGPAAPDAPPPLAAAALVPAGFSEEEGEVEGGGDGGGDGEENAGGAPNSTMTRGCTLAPLRAPFAPLAPGATAAGNGVGGTKGAQLRSANEASSPAAPILKPGALPHDEEKVVTAEAPLKQEWASRLDDLIAALHLLPSSAQFAACDQVKKALQGVKVEAAGGIKGVRAEVRKGSYVTLLGATREGGDSMEQLVQPQTDGSYVFAVVQPQGLAFKVSVAHKHRFGHAALCEHLGARVGAQLKLVPAEPWGGRSVFHVFKEREGDGEAMDKASGAGKQAA